MHKIVLIPFFAASVSGCVLQLPPQQQEPPPATQQVHSSSTTWDAQAPKPQPQSPPASSDNDWIDFGTSNGMTYQFKKGSFRFDQDTKGNALAVGLGRVFDSTNGQVTAGQWYVPVDDCLREMGSLVMTDIHGAALWRVDFMFDAGNIASNLAQTMCGAAYQKAYELKQQDQRQTKPAKPKGSAI
ncbi:hypothetical protein D3C77_266940 [compost metagenome]